MTLCDAAYALDQLAGGQRHRRRTDAHHALETGDIARFAGPGKFGGSFSVQLPGAATATASGLLATFAAA